MIFSNELKNNFLEKKNKKNQIKINSKKVEIL